MAITALRHSLPTVMPCSTFWLSITCKGHTSQHCQCRARCERRMQERAITVKLGGLQVSACEEKWKSVSEAAVLACLPLQLNSGRTPLMNSSSGPNKSRAKAAPYPDMQNNPEANVVKGQAQVTQNKLGIPSPMREWGLKTPCTSKTTKAETAGRSTGARCSPGRIRWPNPTCRWHVP